MFRQRNHTVLYMRQGVLTFPFVSMQLKTTDHNYSNVMEPILSPKDVTIPPNDHTIITIQYQIYAENAVTRILQPCDFFHEEGDVAFCVAIVTLNEKAMGIHVKNFTDQPYKLKKRLHVANFSAMTPEQMKHVRPVDPVSTRQLRNENEENASTISAVFLKRPETMTNKNNIGSRHLKVHETKSLIRRYKNEYFEYYGNYEKWKN